MKVFRLGELFSGPGGLALGAAGAKVESGPKCFSINHAWAVDSDSDACRTFRANLCPGDPDRVINLDVQKLDLNKLEKIDAFAFGFPCNDFSLVGKKLGLNGKYGPLYQYGVEVLNHFRPNWFVAENVGGLHSADAGLAFEKIICQLKNAGSGYRITAHLYRLEDYGVPQTRHRIIIVGIKRKTGLEFKVPAPTHSGSPITARAAIELPPIPRNAPNNELTKQSATVVARLKHILPGENAWNARLPPELRLNVKGARLSQIYKRLNPDKPAYTITGSGGGGTHVYHWEDPRALTNRERARLQTFPDDFIFYGSKESVRKQIGMAVPPLAAKLILTSVLKTFAGIPYPWVEPKWRDDHGHEKFRQISFLDDELPRTNTRQTKIAGSS